MWRPSPAPRVTRARDDAPGDRRRASLLPSCTSAVGQDSGITSVDLQGIDNAEIIETVHALRAPMVPVHVTIGR